MKEIVRLALVSFGINLAFTLGDFLFHLLPYYHVSNIYFVNKLVFGTALLFVGLIAFEKINVLDNLPNEVKAFLIGLIVVFLLQLRYIELYPVMWNLVVVLVHKLVLVPLIWLAYQTNII